MENLPESLLIEILTRLNDSTDATRCRLVSKAFEVAYPQLRSIDLECSHNMYIESRSRVSLTPNSPQLITAIFKSIFLKLVSTLRVVESVHIDTYTAYKYVPVKNVLDYSNDLWLTDVNFVKLWLPRVSGALKLLSVSDFVLQSYHRQSNFLQMVSIYCHKLLKLYVGYAWISLDNLNLMEALTSLTLDYVRLEEKDLSMLNACFPNLQYLHLNVSGREFQKPKIHLLKLKKCHWTLVGGEVLSMTVTTPNLTTLELKCERPTTIKIQAPMLSEFQLALDPASTISVKEFLNLKTLFLESLYLLSKFPVTKTVESVTVDSPRRPLRDVGDTEFTLGKLFNVFPNVISLCLRSDAWNELEARYNPLGWQSWDGREGFKSFCAYLSLANPSLTFTSVAIVLNHCIGLSEVSFLIHDGVRGCVSRRFVSRCTRHWPGLKWRWGVWKEGCKDSWKTDGKF